MEDDFTKFNTPLATHISIHVPRVEDDLVVVAVINAFHISIHVPRVEDDILLYVLSFRRTDFNPRPPCGGRL